MTKEYSQMQENKISQQQKDWKVLEFFAPIEEKLVNEEDEFIIRGVAINETTTLNNVTYIAEELEKAASSFRKVPILLDHRNEVKNIVGRTTENVIYNPTARRIEFEGKIMDKDIREMIKDGRIGSVSIGARVQDLEEQEDGTQRAIGIHGLEISLVAVPGDSQATFAHAIQHSIHLREMVEKLNGGNFVMAEEIKSNETSGEESEEKTEKETEETEETKEIKEEKVQNINVKVDTSEIADLKKQISEMKELLIQKKQLKEQIENSEDEDETKGEVSEDKEEALEKLDNLIIEKSKGGYSLYRDYSKESADTNLKRLIR
jgi:hypothetical protein